jgi:hypothetical protein
MNLKTRLTLIALGLASSAIGATPAAVAAQQADGQTFGAGNQDVFRELYPTFVAGLCPIIEIALYFGIGVCIVGSILSLFLAARGGDSRRWKMVLIFALVGGFLIAPRLTLVQLTGQNMFSGWSYWVECFR